MHLSKIFLLLFLLFNTISCQDSKLNPFVTQNVFELHKEEEIAATFQHNGFKGESFSINADVKIKLTISDEDNCVYYIYTVKGAKPSQSTTRENFTEAMHWLKPTCFKLRIFDVENNEIFSFFPLYPSVYSELPNATKIEFPYTRKGKLHSSNWASYMLDKSKEISAKSFRSKIKRMSSHSLKICFSKDGQDSYQLF